ncbi:TetR/AcrR family transcriptional regulator [Anaerotignum sp.]|uniref:TetR/AcrR family transcriptional regulator n=1 Tax=Anaerotignum sp. TaxID=2039241 RepID=UPI002714C7F9|nr:TetR/AcrR family transcriptional regulator [Anaerotignum sp.]
MRQVKEHNERKKEILDTAQTLFSIKGYEQCSVNDILTEIGIAKGTFYHYFKSKEEVLDAIVERTTEIIIGRAEDAAKRAELPPIDKLMHIFLSIRIEDEMPSGLLEEMHKPENVLMHQKSLSATVTALTPILVNVIEVGIKKGDFQAEYPREYMQIFLASALTLLDDGIFQIQQMDRQRMFQALITVLYKMLNVDKQMLWNKSEMFFQR